MQAADGGAGGFFFSCAYAVGAAKSTTVVEPTIIAMASAMCFTILICPSQANSNDPAKVKASMSAGAVG
jgi:hypothetical protein